ncbi:PQQ-dependent sugar dehydrogenase [Pontiellaceae bacterium B1224]|nr:PQQ-dependent sugar dehydrogenase [Pontiellaceae bacterium B1224]
MKFGLCAFVFCFVLSIYGQLVREANTSLNFPDEAPVYSSFQFENAFPTIGTFTRPVALVSPPGETNMLFVVEQDGRIQRITDLSGTPEKSAFLDISGPVDSSSNEEGLLGMAFHPNFQSNRFFYVFYTHPNNSSDSTRKDRLSRFQAPPGWASTGTVDAVTEVVLIDQPDDRSNHNGGDLHFGPDGYLYLSLGDEGAGNDSRQNSQTITKDFFSGIIRIDVDKKSGSLEPNTHTAGAVVLDDGIARYGIPPDNPFVGATTFNGEAVSGNVRTEFWATGLRNPWRMAFDPVTGRLYVGDVGQDAREDVHLVAKGDNCGWNYREGTIDGPDANEAPAGFNPVEPIFEYAHVPGSKSVIGGRVYRGGALPQLYGVYFLADAYDGRVWGLTETLPGSGAFTDEIIVTGEHGIVAFGEHPATHELLVLNANSGQIKQLVAGGAPSGSLPSTLTATGAFSDLATLTPNTGIVAYAPNVNFWSDGAVKSRWFSIPDINDDIGWNRDANWTFPAGAVWIKHFDLRTDLGEPAVWKRLETRFIIKTTNRIYGVTYKWNDAGTEAFLLPSEGTNENLTITLENDATFLQTWSYPSRSQCVQCHTHAGGYALSFNTRQLNREQTYGVVDQNQIQALEQAGYFSNAVDSIPSLPRVFPVDDTSQSLHVRARSYFDVNCANCHQPGGTTPAVWNGLMATAFSDAQIYNGAINQNNGNTAARFAVPGNTNNSMVLHRIAATPPFDRMPPIGSNVRDLEAEELLANWIQTELGLYAPYKDWRTQQTVDPGEPDEDPDGDGADNEWERLTRSDPNAASNVWNYSFGTTGTNLVFQYTQLAGLDVQIQSSTNLFNWSEWMPRQATFPVTNISERVEWPVVDQLRYFRMLISEP